jgi:hypothetical protein
MLSTVRQLFSSKRSAAITSAGDDEETACPGLSDSEPTKELAILERLAALYVVVRHA